MLFALATMLVLFIVGLWLNELRWLHILYALVVALIGFVAFAFFGWHPAGYVVVIATIDIVLILMIFKGDISLR
jgi:hypothetical protein